MISAVIAIVIPIVLAGLGGLISDHGGKLNIALEGLILTGGFAAYAALEATGSILTALAAASFSAALAGAFLGLLHLRGGGNLFIGGLALNLLLPSLITTLSQNIYGTRGVLQIKGFDGGLHSPSGLPLFIPLTLTAGGLTLYALYRTRRGLNLRTAGGEPELLRQRGLSPESYQWSSLAASGFFSGLAGAFLTLRLGAFVPGMSAGRGWIALVIIYLGFRHPLGLLAAAVLYGMAEESAILLQGSLKLPSGITLAAPYLILLLFLILPSLFRPKR